MPTAFETKTCSRCGGSGHYSFNMIDGTVCYGCMGRGWKYTARGAAAKKFYDDLLTIKVEEVTVGMLVWLQGGMWNRAQWGKVTEIKPSTCKMTIDGKQIEGLYDVTCEYTKNPGDHITLCSYETFRRKPVSEEERLEFLDQALDYQSTLTQLGKPRKVRK